MAHKYAGDEELDRSNFKGGEDTDCFKILRTLDFYIERKDFVTTFLENFLQQANEGKDLVTKDYLKNIVV